MNNVVKGAANIWIKIILQSIGINWKQPEIPLCCYVDNFIFFKMKFINEMKRLFSISLIFILIIFNACKHSKNSSSSSGSSHSGNVKYDTDELVAKAKKHIGTRYRSGGCEPGSGFDCSGFTRYMYEKFSVYLPPTAAQQAESGRAVLLNEAHKGDLIFFKGGDAKSKNVGHVGIIVSARGEQPIKFIHASSSKGIMISGLDEKYFRERFVRIRRVN